jgi:hypothetical protein
VSLLEFQTALGRAVRVETGQDPLSGLDFSAGERADLAALVASAGFRFTVDVQRSWSMGRAAKAAQLTLSILPATERKELLEEWVNSGGGTASFFAAEADAFLDFIAGHLPNPSHTLTVCRVEQATLRASEGALRFAAPDLSRLETPGCLLAAGRSAALVQFYAEPRLVFAALAGEPFPPLSLEVMPVFFGPGLEGLFRLAKVEEVALWERLVTPVALTELMREGHPSEAIETLLLGGVVEDLNL